MSAATPFASKLPETPCLVPLTEFIASPVNADDDGLKESSATSGAEDWLLWQLADSAFPTGGFAHSGGIEAAWQHREVFNSADVEGFIRAALIQTGRGMLPLMLAVFDDIASLTEMDALCDTFLTNHVANRASRLQGQALFASASRIFGATKMSVAEYPTFGHLAAIFGVTARALGFERKRAARMFLFWHLRGWLAGAVRLGIVGPLEAQALQLRLGIFAEEAVDRFMNLGVENIAQTAPLLDLWQGAQDRLYSRLFQS